MGKGQCAANCNDKLVNWYESPPVKPPTVANSVNEDGGATGAAPPSAAASPIIIPGDDEIVVRMNLPFQVTLVVTAFVLNSIVSTSGWPVVVVVAAVAMVGSMFI